MNDPQRLWWEQAKSDHGVFIRLRKTGVPDCHLLHYLQMSSEKISKAYFWRAGNPPPRSHVGFWRFLKALLSRPRKELELIAKVFEFSSPKSMDAWITQIAPLVHDLENLSPDLANDGPNPEYPWPHVNPKHCPALHSFALWTQLQHATRGRNLLKFLERAITRFAQYA
jgi:hypothetical protein